MADRLEDVVVRLRAFVAEREWEQFHDPKNLAIAVASEAGELLAEYRWIANAEADAWSKEPDNCQRVAMEAADVGIALLLLCERVGIDFVGAMNEKIQINHANYPAEEARGQHSRPLGR
ncbi:MAG: nucleotide pyrophosphohydrolase [Gemmatimonadales bacterium]|nr:nucleotide pyrophosphohydrolase [Gemmatimonadales bacterium]